VLWCGVVIMLQNIDSLHQQTASRWDTASQLIEVHGRLGLYHCGKEGQGSIWGGSRTRGS
jgi:NAD-dependent SIR2 family protein deacetylase